jgi:hypothetical protein
VVTFFKILLARLFYLSYKPFKSLLVSEALLLDPSLRMEEEPRIMAILPFKIPEVDILVGHGMVAVLELQVQFELSGDRAEVFQVMQAELRYFIYADNLKLLKTPKGNLVNVWCQFTDNF